MMKILKTISVVLTLTILMFSANTFAEEMGEPSVHNAMPTQDVAENVRRAINANQGNDTLTADDDLEVTPYGNTDNAIKETPAPSTLPTDETAATEEPVETKDSAATAEPAVTPEPTATEDSGEENAENPEETPLPTAAPAYDFSNVHISTRCISGDHVKLGDTVTLLASIEGLDGIAYSIQWQYFDGDWQDQNGANEISYSFILTQNNANYRWRVIVTVDE